MATSYLGGSRSRVRGHHGANRGAPRPRLAGGRSTPSGQRGLLKKGYVPNSELGTLGTVPREQGGAALSGGPRHLEGPKWRTPPLRRGP
jgi:hypothetical protein